MAKLDSERSAEAAEVHNRIESLGNELASVREISKALRKTKQEANELAEETSSVLETDVQYSDELGLVYTSVPDGLAITEATFAKENVTIEGEASQRRHIINYATTIENSEQFRLVQTVSITEVHTENGQTIFRFSLEALR